MFVKVMLCIIMFDYTTIFIDRIMENKQILCKIGSLASPLLSRFLSYFTMKGVVDGCS